MLKKAILEALLKEAFPWVVVDTTYPGVMVPDYLKGQPVSFRLLFERGPQIPDLTLDSKGISGTFSFNNGAVLFPVHFPWDSCLQFHDGVEPSFQVGFRHVPVVEAAPEPKKRPPFLRVV